LKRPDDDAVDEAVSPARVGLSVKGITPDDIQRGDILGTPDSMKIAQEITMDYNQNAFFKGELAENQMFLINIGLQIRPGKITSLNPMKVSLGKPAVFEKNEICVLLKPESQTIRIVGSGNII